MGTVFEMGLANAFVAMLLGAGTFFLGRWWRQPAVIHVLWIVVLVKLITPPLVSLPLPAFGLSLTNENTESPLPNAVSEDEFSEASSASESNSRPDSTQQNLWSTAGDPNGGEPDEYLGVDSLEERREVSEFAKIESGDVAIKTEMEKRGESHETPSEVASLPTLESSRQVDQAVDGGDLVPAWVLPCLFGVWILGSVSFMGLMLVRIRRFQRLLRQLAEDAPPDLGREVERLAISMGLSHAPRLVLVPGAVSPLVWAFGKRPVIVFPKGLLVHLDPVGRRSLLLHELTHLRRRDHWVRGLELIVGCLYWWLPLVWFARKELQHAEEECCDAWVVWWMLGERRPYAKALLHTLDFLAGTPPEMPPAASGLGHLALLRQRMQGILKGDVPRSLGWRGTIATVLCGLMILPVVPSLGQTDPAEEPPEAIAVAETSALERSDTAADSGVPSTAAEVAKQYGYQTTPVMEPAEFRSQPQTFPSFVENAQGSAFSGDGRWLITVYGRTNETGEVRIWDVSQKTERVKWNEPKGIRSVAMAPDGRTFAYGTYGGVLKLGNVETGQLQPSWKETTTGVESLAFSDDGRWLATGSTEGLIQVWEVATGKIAQTLRGHTGQVYGVGFLPDGGTIASCGQDKTLKLWQRASGEVIHSLDHPSQMYSLAVAPDGKLVATGCQDGNVRLWESETGKLRTTLAPRRGAISVAFDSSGDTLAASNGGGFTLWNVKTGEPQPLINTGQGNVHQVTISRDGKVLATTSWDRSVKLWNMETRAEVAHLVPVASPDDEPHAVLAAAWSPDNSLVASVHEDKSIRVREGSTGEVRAVLVGHEDVVSDLNFSPDGKILATASLDHTLKLWRIDPMAKESLHSLEGHANWVMCLAFSPDGTKLASGSYDRTIRIWDVKNGKELQKLEGHTAAVRSLVFLSNDHFASGSSDRTVKLWDLGSSKELASLKQHTGAVRGLAYAPKTQRLASAGEDKTIKLWDLSKFDPAKADAEMPLLEPQNLPGHPGMIWSLAFSPGGIVLASGDLTGQIKLWNPATGQERTTLKGHNDIVTTLAFATHGRFLLSGSYDKRLLLWRGEVPVPTLAEIATISKPANRVRVALISPDGRWLALGGGKSETELRDLKALNAAPVLIKQGKSTSHLAFSPDSRLIAIGTYSGEIKLWDLQEKRWLTDLISHEGQVQRVAFSPDGKQLASVGWDHVLKLWDLTEHKLIATSAKQPLLMSDVTFSPDGKQLATCSGNWKEWRTPGEIKLWSVDPLKEIKVLGGHEQEIRGVVFTPTGDRLVSYSSSSAGTTRVWDLKTGKELGRFAGCAALTLLPGGDQAVTGDLYGKMGLWDLNTFKLLRNFTGHTDLVYTLSHSSDGSLLVSVCRDGAVTLWPSQSLSKPSKDQLPRSSQGKAKS